MCVLWASAAYGPGVYPEDQRSAKPTAVPHPETPNSSQYLFQDTFYHLFSIYA